MENDIVIIATVYSADEYSQPWYAGYCLADHVNADCATTKFGLDMLFTVNIMIGLIIIMVSVNVSKPLEFSSFPSILLLATMLRLSLNVASTRVVLVRTSGSVPPGQ